MIIVSAKMWPRGDAAQAYELLHASINNISEPGAALDTYSAHVLSRPNRFFNLEGFEADLQVTGHHHAAGLIPLLLPILGQAYTSGSSWDQKAFGITFPSVRTLVRERLHDAAAFEAAVRGRQS